MQIRFFWLPVITMRSKESRQCLAVSDTSCQQLAISDESQAGADIHPCHDNRESKQRHG